MTIAQVAITGYYGFRNLGDDILMLCTFNLVKQLLPNAEISILTESKNPEYIHELLGSQVKIVSSANSIRFDLIVHGGGGVYFDFIDGNTKYYWLNRLIKAIGIGNFSLLIKQYRKLKNYSGISAGKRVGLGIGVGTYTPSSSKFHYNIQILADYDLLFVRDADSLEQVKQYGFSYPVYLSSDLAFLRSFWLPALPARVTVPGKKIGIILRDWPYDNNEYFNAVAQCCQQLTSSGFTITCYALDATADKEFIKRFSPNYSVNIWQPDQVSLTEYLLNLQQQDLIISSRAHGAIAAACIGIPVICLGIEEKLAAIAQMLESSSALLPVPFNADELMRLVEDRFKKLEKYQELTRQDILINESKVYKSVEILKNFLAQV